MTDTKVPVIDRTRMLELIDRAVEERGADYLYPAPGHCMFIWGHDGTNVDELSDQTLVKGQPACLLGLALSYLESEIPGVLEYLIDHSGADLSGLMEHENKPFDLTDDALECGSRAQNAQDNDKTWGIARQAAHEWEPEDNDDD